MPQVSTKGDAGAQNSQTKDSLQRQPWQINHGPHAVAVQLHKGILEKKTEKKKISTIRSIEQSRIKNLPDSSSIATEHSNQVYHANREAFWPDAPSRQWRIWAFGFLQLLMSAEALPKEQVFLK